MLALFLSPLIFLPVPLSPPPLSSPCTPLLPPSHSFPPSQDGRPDRSYFTPDCFHLSQKSQSLMARALWNNMVGLAQT